MKDHLWIVVANSSKARIFRAPNNQSLEEIDTLIHPASRKTSSELTTDKPGKAYSSFGTGNHIMGDAQDPHKQEALKFAREVASYLEQGLDCGDCRNIHLSASPTFLGHLREAMSERVRKAIGQEIAKDLTALKLDEIRTHLPYTL